jgi:glyoxylase-like metal-dependent hydrolase (beta-lactamase superfamily II)
VKVQLEVAPGVHLVEHAHTNCYLVVEDGEVTVVDTCFPSTWRAIGHCLHRIGLGLGDITAVVLTHGHFDHVGSARLLQARLGVPVWVHAGDRRLAAHPYRYRPERNRALFPVGHPRSLPVLGAMVAAGALTVRGVEADRTFGDGDVLPVPGRLEVIHTPGHTDGECAFSLPGRSTVLSGDALVTLDPYTGLTGPRLVAPAATADTTAATRSLERLRLTGTTSLLPGHGRPWRGSADQAVEEALNR